MRFIWLLLFLASIWIVWFFLSLPGHARDLDGKYKDSPLHAWFDSLASKKGLCCSFADGVMLTDDQIDTDTDGQHYKVKMDGEWITVPDEALITEPNKFGRPVVWPYKDAEGKTQIRCFMPGAGI